MDRHLASSVARTWAALDRFKASCPTPFQTLFFNWPLGDALYINQNLT